MFFSKALRERRLLADGAMATELQKRGLPLHNPADPWVLTHPDAVLAVHQSYVAAGCELLLTNSMNANASAYPVEEAIAMNRAAVGIARQSGARWVAGSMGPGADEIQATALAEAGVDLFWLETQLTLTGVLDSITACRQVAPTTPILVTFSFHQPTTVTHTGETIAEIATSLSDKGIVAIGVNCGNGFMNLDRVVEEFMIHTSLPLVLKPNAGIPVIENDHLIYTLSPHDWHTHLTSLITPQIRIIGGCCGTTPAHLEHVHKTLII